MAPTSSFLASKKIVLVPLSELEKGSLQPIFKKELSSAHARMTRLNQSEDFIRIHPLAGLLLAY